MFRRRLITHAFLMTEGDVADIFIKMMRRRVAIMVGFISAYRMFVPFAGKHALSTNRFKTTTDAANSGK
ncbi:hypothetical protein HmCmsJML016_03271 [Escherichia coli]|nr:hypothetical protein HmCmsJML016_03271 [Escherichia coli]